MSGAVPEERVRVPMLRQAWRNVVFLHWKFEPQAVQELLPSGLTIDEFDGAAWVTLLSFAVRDMRPAVGPSVPLVSDFTETNVRTYVRGPDGRDGLWFFTLETDSLPSVVGARPIGIPYRWARMTARGSGDEVVYGSRRRCNGSPPMHLTSVAVIGPDDVIDDRGHWLTGRWRAWTRIGRRFATVPVEHQPWSFESAALIAHEDTLLADSHLPDPAEPALVHFAGGVDAVLGWPRSANCPAERARAGPK